MSDGVHDTLIAQTRGDAREHLFCLTILLLSWFVLDLMCISFELDEKVANCLLKITQSRYCHNACDPIWSIVLAVFIKLETAVRIYPLGGCVWFVPGSGDKGVLVLYKKIISDYCCQLWECSYPWERLKWVMVSWY
jgi:hypothetical protein